MADKIFIPKFVFVLAAAVALAACDQEAPELDALRRFDGYPLYFAGTAVAGLPLTHAEVLPNQTFFIYGDCETGVGVDPGGCAPPVEIQIWPSRPIAAGLRGCEEIRGVPAAMYGDRIEVFTDTVTVVVFGHPRYVVARALRGVNTDVAADQDLPPPTRDREVPCPKRPGEGEGTFAPEPPG